MQRSLLQQLLRLLEGRAPFVVATVVKTEGSAPARPGARMIVCADGRAFGTVGGAALEEQVTSRARDALAEGRGGLHSFVLWHQSPQGLDSLCGGKVEVFVEHVRPRPHLLICGGGHIGLALARLCEPLDYSFSVCDPRPDFASPARFPEARGLYGELPVASELERFSHLVVCGHAHAEDLKALERALPHFDGYVGLVASRKKKEEIFRALRERGLGEERLSRVESPVGLPIGAETPAEIAVSIMASIIRSWAGLPAAS